jgi:histidyl-tRNA synthetase
MRRWLLPEHIEDVLPAEARVIERLRRTILDLFEVHGYELVAPPLLEYVESLLSGTGRDMDLATFKLVARGAFGGRDRDGEHGLRRRADRRDVSAGRREHGLR